MEDLHGENLRRPKYPKRTLKRAWEQNPKTEKNVDVGVFFLIYIFEPETKL